MKVTIDGRAPRAITFDEVPPNTFFEYVSDDTMLVGYKFSDGRWASLPSDNFAVEGCRPSESDFHGSIVVTRRITRIFTEMILR